MSLKNKFIDIKYIFDMKKIPDGRTLLVIFIASSFCLAVINGSADISPSLVEKDLEAGECYIVTKTVEIPTILQKVDVIFAFDLTSSMGDILNTAKLEIGQVMNTLITSYPGVNFTFGVISYMDYPDTYSSCGYNAPYGIIGDYAYSLNQSLTYITTDVITVVNNLFLGNGGDAPEDYTRIFYESFNDSNIGWRTDAVKLLVNFGDNVPHDCNLNEGLEPGTWSTGNDPGPDEEMGTSDDLDLQTVLNTMNSSGITLIECHRTSANYKYWNYWTGLTGGSVHITSSSNFVEKVTNAIISELPNLKVYNLQLIVTTQGFENWLTLVDPPSYSEVARGTSVIFNETICVPIGTPSGLYEFNISVIDKDGVNYGNQTNKINVNEPPTANEDSAITKEDTSVWINVTDNDNDNDGTLNPSTVTITNGPSEGTTSINTTTGEIYYTPDPDFHGSDSFTYTIDDDDGATSNAAEVTIKVSGVNDPPVIITSDDPTAVEDELYSVDYDAIDDDLDILTWTLWTDAVFLVIDADTGLLFGTPNNSHVGSYYVNVTVDDGNGGSDFSNFTLNVINVNDPPNAPSNPKPKDGATGVDVNPTLSVNVTDPDNDVLHVSFFDDNDNLIGVDIGIASGDIASVNWNGLLYSSVYSWYAVVNDTEFINKSSIWSFTTRGPPGGVGQPNQNPEADASESETLGFVGEKIQFDGSLSQDSDGDILNWTWDFGDGEKGYGETTTHIYSEEGTYSVKLTVKDDDGAKDDDTITVTIKKGNHPPTKPILDGPATGNKNFNYEFTALSFDADNDSIQYIFDWGDGETTTTGFLKNGTTTYQTHNWTKYGKYLITVKAYDDVTESDTTEHTILIDVIPISNGIMGYLVDENSDGIFDSFENSETAEKTDVEKDNGNYLIDSDGDEKWDHAYSQESGLITYYIHVYQKYFEIYQVAKNTPGFELITLLVTITLISIILRRRRKYR